MRDNSENPFSLKNEKKKIAAYSTSPEEHFGAQPQGHAQSKKQVFSKQITRGDNNLPIDKYIQNRWKEDLFLPLFEKNPYRDSIKLDI